jgi:tyrosine phenol-lyase
MLETLYHLFISHLHFATDFAFARHACKPSERSMTSRTIIEPFRIKVVEPIRMTTAAEREELLRQASFNTFLLKSDDVLIDLLTDSGTGAMSAEQWAGVMRADESYAGASSYFRFRDSVRDITGFEHVLPTHQGRASERILFEVMGGPGKIVPANAHFDTTRANCEHSGCRAINLPIKEASDPRNRHPFKGNMDVDALAKVLAQNEGNVPLVIVTVTNNTGGGQPVSLENIRAVRKLCDQHKVPMFLDACRFGENAWFIKQREAGMASRSARSIVREMFELADGATISAKKDGMVNIGGVLLLRDQAVLQKASELLILTEGYVTYGGLAGRDLEAMAQGFQEVVQEDYLHYRVRCAEFLGERLIKSGIQIIEPPGGHAIYIDAKHFCPHIPVSQFPGQAVVAGLYRTGGIRACEIGSVMFGGLLPDGSPRPDPSMELVRLAIPRRVYTESHIQYVCEVAAELFAKRSTLKGLRIIEAPAVLRHFTAKFEEMN